MSLHSKRSIRILNPVPEGAHFTNRRSARRYVEQGRARWVGESAIEFDAADHRHLAAADATAPARAHSPRLEIIARQRAIGAYRNEVLGLPNFVGFQRERGTSGRRVA